MTVHVIDVLERQRFEALLGAKGVGFDLAWYAARPNLGVETYLGDLDTEAIGERVWADVAREEANGGARGTPMFFVGNPGYTGPLDTKTLDRALEAPCATLGVLDGR